MPHLHFFDMALVCCAFFLIFFVVNIIIFLMLNSMMGASTLAAIKRWKEVSLIVWRWTANKSSIAIMLSALVYACSAPVGILWITITTGYRIWAAHTSFSQLLRGGQDG